MNESKPVAWQWLDTATFRKSVPASSNPSEWTPLYAHPAPDAKPVGKFAQFTDGVWREVTKGSPGVPLYEHPPAADVQELVEALKWIEKRCNEGLFEDGVLHQEHWKAAHDAGACARAYLKKREGK